MNGRLMVLPNSFEQLTDAQSLAHRVLEGLHAQAAGGPGGGLSSTLIFLVSVLLTVGRASSIQDTYDVLVNLTILLYFVPYLYLFASFVRLGGTPGSEGGVRAPGGPAGRWLAGACGLFATGTSLALVFVPPAGTASVVNYEVNLVGQAVLLLLAGMVLFWRARRKASASALRTSEPL